MRLMVLSVKRKSDVLEYAQIIEDFVENGRKNTRLVKHLGRIESPEDMDRYTKIFSPEKKRGDRECRYSHIGYNASIGLRDHIRIHGCFYTVGNDI